MIVIRDTKYFFEDRIASRSKVVHVHSHDIMTGQSVYRSYYRYVLLALSFGILSVVIIGETNYWQSLFLLRNETTFRFFSTISNSRFDWSLGVYHTGTPVEAVHVPFPVVSDVVAPYREQGEKKVFMEKVNYLYLIVT